jgi:uncharacterized protein (DUF2062 family)
MRIKKYLPTRERLKKTRSLQFLGDMILEPNLWHLNRYSLSFAALIGGFCMFLPIPFQMVPAALLCVWIRCNVPVTLLLVWSSNPITMGPMMYFAYRVGLWLLGMENQTNLSDPSFQWFMDQIGQIWQPLILGCLMCGSVVGITGFIAVRLYYRWRVTRYKQRKRGRKPGDITRI